MDWKTCHSRDLPEIMEQLKIMEWEHISLSSSLLKNGRYSLPNPLKNGTLSVLKERDTYKGIFYRTRWGTLFTWFHPGALNRKDIVSYLQVERRIPNILVGTRDRVDLIADCMNKPIRHFNDYFLMKRFNKVTQRPLIEQNLKKDELCIKIAGPADGEKLLHLEVSYQKEEVLIHPEKAQPRSILLNFKKKLKTEYICYMTYRDYPIAKAGTNAQGFKWDQIGGVYTAETMRNRGIARMLMDQIHNRRENRSTALFVKKDNSEALSLYRKLKYDYSGDFRILYFRT